MPAKAFRGAIGLALILFVFWRYHFSPKGDKKLSLAVWVLAIYGVLYTAVGYFVLLNPLDKGGAESIFLALVFFIFGALNLITSFWAWENMNWR